MYAHLYHFGRANTLKEHRTLMLTELDVGVSVLNEKRTRQQRTVHNIGHERVTATTTTTVTTISTIATATTATTTATTGTATALAAVTATATAAATVKTSPRIPARKRLRSFEFPTGTRMHLLMQPPSTFFDKGVRGLPRPRGGTVKTHFLFETTLHYFPPVSKSSTIVFH